MVEDSRYLGKPELVGGSDEIRRLRAEIEELQARIERLMDANRYLAIELDNAIAAVKDLRGPEIGRLRASWEYAYGPSGELARLREELRGREAEIERLRASSK